MKKLKSAEIRQMFLDFFKEKNHKVLPSASLVPKEDPSLLWINSGVATLKKYFDGREIPDNPKIVSSQKAIRTNDIENVGFTARHHTFFEMLGNFSIGDYFKKDAIKWAWEFLTDEKWLAFDPELLSVTVHPEDDEAYDIWLKEIKLPKERIIRLEENFWDIGEGPSGPNSEIFYDRGEAFGNDLNDPELYPGGENSRYLEIWNLVFSQFNHNPDDTYTPLPKKNIDTGMGLERVCSVIQGVPTNFETDLFMPIINQIEEISNVSYGNSIERDAIFKVIADHIRTVSFAIADGALPSNEGRGYVLRRLIRRAVRFAKNIGLERPFMYELVVVVGDIMKEHYPQVLEQKDYIEKIIKVEEERFHETLNDGLEILAAIMKREEEAGKNIFPGKEVFRLYDTYGFPKELTAEYVEEHGFTIDEAGYEAEMEKQRERARSARKNVDSMQVQDSLMSEIDIASKFIGYHQLEANTSITAMINQNEHAEAATENDEVFIFLAETPFYAESGGQIADKGWIYTKNASAYVEDVQKSPQGIHVHRAVVKNGEFHAGDKVKAIIEREFRNGIIKNHTATHLLHQALKDVLGNHVNQAGSLVTPDRLRFDFSHFEAIKEEELQEIETIVNEKIWESIQLVINNKRIDEAKAMGAMALFGEKYGEIVRVVQIEDYSIELCGGCHVRNTSEIGLFKIVSEAGIGTGTRRIEAVTSKMAYAFLNEKTMTLKTVRQLVKANEDKIIPEKIQLIQQELKSIQKENESLSTKLANVEVSSILEQVEDISGVPVLAQQVNVKDMNQLRNMVDDLKQKLDAAVILLVTENSGKVQLAAGISKEFVQKGLHAGNLIKQAAQICGGGGGGRPDMAQAGGTNPAKITEALESVREYVKEKINE